MGSDIAEQPHERRTVKFNECSSKFQMAVTSTLFVVESNVFFSD